MNDSSFINFYLSLKVLMLTALINLDSFADALKEFFVKIYKNTGEKIFAKYLYADGCFVK